MTTDRSRAVTAGTAGDGYRAERPPHAFVTGPPEPNCRPLCTVPGCGRERTEHPVPAPRSGGARR